MKTRTLRRVLRLILLLPEPHPEDLCVTPVVYKEHAVRARDVNHPDASNVPPAKGVLPSSPVLVTAATTTQASRNMPAAGSIIFAL